MVLRRRRDHELQNPTSPEKIRLLGERLRRRHDEARKRYLRIGRERLGWAIFVGWKR